MSGWHGGILVLLLVKGHQVGTIWEPYLEELKTNWFHLLTDKPQENTLYTINQTRFHLYRTVQRYYQVPNDAVGSFQVAPTSNISWPMLRVYRFSLPTIAYPLIRSKEEWPVGLAPNATEDQSRIFFDTLHHMQLQLYFQGQPPFETTKLLWAVQLEYDLSSQAQIQLSHEMHLVSSQTSTTSTALVNFLLLGMCALHQVGQIYAIGLTR